MDKKKSSFRVDAHQHFWIYNQEEYKWIDESMVKLRRNFLPSHLNRVLKRNGFDFCVTVQARQTLQETKWLLELAQNNSFIKGIVGWVDLKSGSVEQDLEKFAAYKKFKGVRHLLQDEDDDRYMLQPDFKKGLSQLKKFDLTYDILIYPRHIKYACTLVYEFPQQKFIIDHLAKPLIKESKIEPWKKDMQKLAREDNVLCKLSGMVTEANWDSWKKEDFIPYMETLLEVFGPNRLLFGSDWPVCTVAAKYEQVLEIVTNFISSLSPAEQAHIMGQNTIDFYNLEV
ncbi:MAG: amidohydrolase family protein [Candidatus Atribacteria bacterium]|nr:amidohydrolase family protein [Candidatus Atribacteria bacterium]MCK4308876.1 amidohydrolase family protein [Candidatus Atribacteria bacterium]